MDVVRALEYLLDRVQENYWRDWLRQNMDAWRFRENAMPSAGMGSLNDVWICAENGHVVTKAQEPWVNTLFVLLKALCFQLAHSPEKELAFPAHLSEVPGWRCRKCGYAEVTFYQMESCLAELILPSKLTKAVTEGELKAWVDAALAMAFEGVDEIRNNLEQAILKRDIVIVDREGWMRPCPQCGSDETAVFYWPLLAHGQDGFERNENNEGF